MDVTDEQFRAGMEQMTLMGRQETMLDQKELSEELYRLSVGFLFGEIWRRPHLTLRERQLITLAANIALSRPTGAHSHYRSSRHIGLKHEEIMEVILHTGMYAGWPVIAHAVKQYGEVLEEDAPQGGSATADTPDGRNVDGSRS